MLESARHDFVRLLICENEVGRLPESIQALQVQSGHAWVSTAGRDYVLGPGASLRLPASRYPALISPLRSRPLIVEVTNGPRAGTRSSATLHRAARAGLHR